MHWQLGLATLICSSFFLANTAKAQPVLLADTGNYYQLVNTSLTWEEANQAATSMIFMGASGHLATITSQEENDFVQSLLVPGSSGSWIGLFQESGAAEPAGGFGWVTDEDLVFDNFGVFEPNNNSGDPLNPNEEFVHILPSGTWNDLNSSFTLSFVVEFEPVLVLGDASMDGVVDSFDIQPFITVLTARSFQAEADINLDGAVDFFDIQPFIDILSGQ